MVNNIMPLYPQEYHVVGIHGRKIVNRKWLCWISSPPSLLGAVPQASLIRHDFDTS